MGTITNLDSVRSIKAAEDLLTLYRAKLQIATTARYQALVLDWEREAEVHPNHILTILKGLYLAEHALKITSIASPLRSKAEETYGNLTRLLDAYSEGLL